MRRAGRVAQLAQQIQTLSEIVQRVQTESAAVNSVAVQGASGERGATGPPGPGFSDGPDVLPTIPHAADDEFNISSSTLDISGTRRVGAIPWNLSLKNAVATISAGSLRLRTTQSVSFEYIWQSVSGSNWVYTSKIGHQNFDSNTSYLGMVMTDSTGSNRFGLFKSYDSGPKIQYLANSNLFNTTTFADDVTFYAPGYFQLEFRTFSSTLALAYARYSRTGYVFPTVQAYSVSWTPSRIGYMIGTSNLSVLGGATPHELTSEWFRCTTSYTPTQELPRILTALGNVTVSGTTHYTFSGNGSFIVQNSNVTIDTLIVGGGGSGGGLAGGGGGGGGVVYATGVTIAPGTYTISIGSGALAVSYGQGLNGGNSSAFGYTAFGGGGGGCFNIGAAAARGLDGGCGGGATYANNTRGIGSQGGNGAAGNGPESGGGGGGGAGANAADASSIGGNGVVNSITGASIRYAGGGGGGVYSARAGGLGGGGTSVVPGSARALSNNGTPNTGGGGGGGGAGGGSTNLLGGDGGSGLVIIRVTG